MIPTAQQLALYFEGKKKSPVYDEATRLYQSIRLHANGEAPGDIIARRRPNESEEVQSYRLQIFEPITKQTFNSVLQSLGKIRRSRDWALRYDRSISFPLIPASETLHEYCERRFPYYGSVSNWLFSVMLKSMLVDANCAVLVLPLKPLSSTSEYLQPYPVIFYADQVIEYLEGRFAILRAADKVEVQTGNAVYVSEKFYLVTPQELVPYIKEGELWRAVADEVVVHGLGYLPIIRPRCQFVRSVQEHNLFESRISAMIPSLNEAIREYSDLQAAVVGHLFPERWEIATQDCSSCGGTGYVPNPSYTGTDGKSKQLVCSACNGLGALAASSPYKKAVIRMPKQAIGEQAVPLPPFDYVKKDIDAIRVMEERLDRHLYRGLSAINMQFLAQVPLSISGEAKAIDRDELNNFVYNVAEDMVYLADYLYAIIADYRYAYQYPDFARRRRMLPYIPVPEHFELLGAAEAMNTIGQMKANGISGSLLAALLADFTKRQWAQEQDIAIPLLLELRLDPFAGMASADRDAMMATGCIPRRDYLRSVYIKDLVKRALSEVAGFADLPFERQMAVIEAYAAEVEQRLPEPETTNTKPETENAAPVVDPDSLPDHEEEGNTGVK